MFVIYNLIPERTAKKSVLIVAGEASADMHGSNLVSEMIRLDSELVFRGIGGENMRKAGVEILFSSSDMAVVGLTEVFPRIRTIYKASRTIKEFLRSGQTDLIILIDYPDFNIHISATASRFNVPVLYYISPQIWAWRKGRIKKISRRVDQMVVILPFEQNFYMKHGVNAIYVGHPIMDSLQRDMQIAGHTATLHDHSFGGPVMGIIPGSRKEEIKRMLPMMLEAVGIIKRSFPEIRCLLPLAPTIEHKYLMPFLKEASERIEVSREGMYNVLSACDIALVTSGTATLETAIMGVPMVVAYKVSGLSYRVGRFVVDAPFISLVNLVAGEEVVKELIQDEATAENLAREALTILENENAQTRLVSKLMKVKDRMGGSGASRRTAEIALRMLRGDGIPLDR